LSPSIPSHLPTQSAAAVKALLECAITGADRRDACIGSSTDKFEQQLCWATAGMGYCDKRREEHVDAGSGFLPCMGWQLAAMGSTLVSLLGLGVLNYAAYRYRGNLSGDKAYTHRTELGVREDMVLRSLRDMRGQVTMATVAGSLEERTALFDRALEKTQDLAFAIARHPAARLRGSCAIHESISFTVDELKRLDASIATDGGRPANPGFIDLIKRARTLVQLFGK